MHEVGRWTGNKKNKKSASKTESKSRGKKTPSAEQEQEQEQGQGQEQGQEQGKEGREGDNAEHLEAPPPSVEPLKKRGRGRPRKVSACLPACLPACLLACLLCLWFLVSRVDVAYFLLPLPAPPSLTAAGRRH